MPICYALFSTIIGTQSVVQAKCLSELLQLTLKGENQLTNPFTYGVLAAWLLSTVYWVHRMNRALSKFPGLFVIPLLQVFWTSLAILTGSCFSIWYFNLLFQFDISFSSSINSSIHLFRWYFLQGIQRFLHPPSPRVRWRDCDHNNWGGLPRFLETIMISDFFCYIFEFESSSQGGWLRWW